MNKYMNNSMQVPQNLMKQALRTDFLTVQGPGFRFKLSRHTLPLGPGSFVTAFASSVLTLRESGEAESLDSFY